MLPRDFAAGGSFPAANAEPLAGTIASVVVSGLAITILSSFITERSLAIKHWTALPFVVWIVFAIFIDSWIFVFATSILKFGLGLAQSFTTCQTAILLCLVCYVTTKILIYLFLVEKAYIIRQGADAKPRLKSKLYLFNSFGMLGVYLIVSILNFVFRITRLEDGQCIIGMRKIAMIPLITFDILVNIYLTILFLIPLRNLYSFRNIQRNAATERLRTIAMRTFVGAASTTVSSVVNLTVLMALDGEPGWVCLMCCNLDIAFSAIMVHWVTSKDTAGSQPTNSGVGDHYASCDIPHSRRNYRSIDLSVPSGLGDTKSASAVANNGGNNSSRSNTDIEAGYGAGDSVIKLTESSSFGTPKTAQEEVMSMHDDQHHHHHNSPTPSSSLSSPSSSEAAPQVTTVVVVEMQNAHLPGTAEGRKRASFAANTTTCTSEDGGNRGHHKFWRAAAARTPSQGRLERRGSKESTARIMDER